MNHYWDHLPELLVVGESFEQLFVLRQQSFAVARLCQALKCASLKLAVARTQKVDKQGLEVTDLGDLLEALAPSEEVEVRRESGVGGSAILFK